MSGYSVIKLVFYFTPSVFVRHSTSRPRKNRQVIHIQNRGIQFCICILVYRFFIRILTYDSLDCHTAGAQISSAKFVLPPGFEPRITVPKTAVISISPRERNYLLEYTIIKYGKHTEKHCRNDSKRGESGSSSSQECWV